MPTYRPAPAVQRIADELIPKHHDHLVGQHIEYVFRDKHATSNGKEVWGKARKITGLNAYLAGDTAEGDEVEDFFVVEIAEDVWALLEPAQRRALVDHELAHCTVDVDEVTGDIEGISLVGHDLEEFKAIVERHGLWRPDISDFLRAARDADQLTLLDDQDRFDATKVTISHTNGDGERESVETTAGGLRRAADHLAKGRA